MRRKLTLCVGLVFASLSVVFLFYFNNTALVHPKTTRYYNKLKSELHRKGYADRLLVISTKRMPWHNRLLAIMNGASPESLHLKGTAMDFLVLDINRDGRADTQDVDIVYDLLDKFIIGNKGGIGTYKMDKWFFNRQSIHIDCRGFRRRWIK
ncbi:MAG: hypothetical protein ACKO3B_07785 [Bacteroidota bacterium]